MTRLITRADLAIPTETLERWAEFSPGIVAAEIRVVIAQRKDQ
jgi:hypothetical protein